ncbi:glutathione S-transferase C-terminal domain-containing protein [Yinghuangia sp. YIM S09857]|uniref:glutathione S-transferase C-terminal domain-containing protein n=1 Tax=Yinghuangia sp. YIM S09857 TaxID=3436929 RepID=UPI003F52D04A
MQYQPPVRLPRSAGPVDFRIHGRHRTLGRPAPRFAGRIGRAPGSGFTADPHRYHLYLCLACPRSLRAAVTRSLCGLEDRVSVSVVDPVRDGRGWAFRAGDGHGLDTAAGFALLREAYEATEYHYDGPVSVPVLWDRWSGRIVSNQTPHILYDLATAFSTPTPGFPTEAPAPPRLVDGHVGHGVRPTPDPTVPVPPPVLHPAGAEDEIGRLGALFEDDIWETAQQAGRARAGDRYDEAMRIVLGALGALEHRLARRPFLLGGHLTAADVHLWATLLHVDAVHRRHLAADDVLRIADHPALWAYFARLYAIPAFRDNLRLDHIARHHTSSCRGPAASGGSVPIVDWPRLTGMPAPAAVGASGTPGVCG